MPLSGCHRLRLPCQLLPSLPCAPQQGCLHTCQWSLKGEGSRASPDSTLQCSPSCARFSLHRCSDNHTHTYACTHMYTLRHTCYTCVHRGPQRYAETQTSVYTYTQRHIHTLMPTQAHICTYRHVYICTQTHIHIQAQA